MNCMTRNGWTCDLICIIQTPDTISFSQLSLQSHRMFQDKWLFESGSLFLIQAVDVCMCKLWQDLCACIICCMTSCIIFIHTRVEGNWLEAVGTVQYVGHLYLVKIWTAHWEPLCHMWRVICYLTYTVFFDQEVLCSTVLPAVESEGF